MIEQEQERKKGLRGDTTTVLYPEGVIVNKYRAIGRSPA